MKRSKLDSVTTVSRLGLFKLLTAVLFVYLLLMSLGVQLVFRNGSESGSREWSLIDALPRPFLLESEANLAERRGPSRPVRDPSRHITQTTTNRVVTRTTERAMQEFKTVSSLFLNESVFDSAAISDEFSIFHKAAGHALSVGKKAWEELQSGIIKPDTDSNPTHNRTEGCRNSISISGSEFRNRSRNMVLPCGLTLGSHITVVAMPDWAHAEHDPKISVLRDREDSVMVSQFTVELQGLKTANGEDPPRMLHFNPRLRGDWSWQPVIEINTCYRMQWGPAIRCEGFESGDDEETIDGEVKCEEWARDVDENQFEEPTTSWWLNRLIGRRKKVTQRLPYPFSEGKVFVLTLRAGMEGYHVNVDGRHVASFPYRTGSVEDAMGLAINGDIDVHSIFAGLLPSTHPSFASQKHLEMSKAWKAPPRPDKPVELFIGILSAGNHFAERMAVRKSWMQHKLIRSSKVVARFFVALHGKKEVNTELKKEAEYFGDIVIVPYMDNYDLVVLKTVAICEYGVREVVAKNIMKCDDDTFVRLDAIIKGVNNVNTDKSLYIGNINYYHRVFRHGKWAVTYEEWPEDSYPPYANGPGYIISSDIAHFIVTEFEQRRLRLFKMEDVSMGMWVGNFSTLKPVEYIHSFKFCQFGCTEDYYTAHYQSPRQMMCMWDKLQRLGKPLCCDMR